MHSASVRRRAGRSLEYALHCTLEQLEGRRLLAAGGRLVDGEAALPRAMTPAEREFVKANPLHAQPGLAAPTAPPTGAIDPVAEYEPMEALVGSWMGATSWLVNLAQIARYVTVEGGGRMYIGVPSASAQTNAINTLTSQGADLSRVTFFNVPLNAIWARDYGPRYVYEGDVRVITDHRYNVPRPLDDAQPIVFSQFKQHQLYEMGVGNQTLVHGGGNYHLNATGDAYATSLINLDNPSFNTATIQGLWRDYQNNNTTITGQFPFSVDGTGHIDMWMQIYDDNKVFISDWPNNPGSVQDNICEQTATLMASRGYQVTRLPAYNIGGVHYTYTNMVLFNDVAVVPVYNNGPGAAVSNQAFATIQAALGAVGMQAFAVNADQIIPAAGAFHCIVQHIPAHKGAAGANGGLAPTAYVRNTLDGQTLSAGQNVEIKWISDDDAPVAATGGVQAVDVQLSTDGGQTFATTISGDRPALGSFFWTVPSGINTSQARIRVVARDALGNTGFDVTDANFTIVDPAVPAVFGSQFTFETAPHRVSVAFSQNVGASLGTDDLVLENLTTSQTIPASDLAVSYDAGTNTATFTYTGSGGGIAGVLADGRYRATLLGAGVTNAGGTPLGTNHVTNFHVLAADATRDGLVNLDDFNAMAANFGQSPRTFSQGDFNYSGTVNLDDFNILAARFGSVLAAASSGAATSPFGQSSFGGADKSDDEVTDELLA